MIATTPTTLICHPAAPINGGPLDDAPEKVGDWSWQPKLNDWRAVLHAPTGTLWAHDGKPCSIADQFTVALDRIKTVAFACEWLDVGLMERRLDLMRGCIIVFDLIEAGAEYWARRARLKATFDVLPFDMVTHLRSHGGQVCDTVYLINEWRGNPKENYADLQTQNVRLGCKPRSPLFEGVVAKKRNSLYPFGRKPKQTTPDWIKHRFDQ